MAHSNVPARRQKWIDMGQSLNLYHVRTQRPQAARHVCFWRGRQGSENDVLPANAGVRLKIEKSTVDINKYGVPAALDEERQFYLWHQG